MFIRTSKRVSVKEFLFDDEPLESILYGAPDTGPTIANLYWPAMQHVRMIVELCKDDDIPSALEKVAELGEKGYPLSLGICLELAWVMRVMVPTYSNPVLTHDLSVLDPLLGAMWDIAMRCADKALRLEVGTVRYRWHEFHHQYEEARHILSVLIDSYRERGSRTDEAIMTNNYGFEYFLERRWRDAAGFFEKAVGLFEECGDKMNRANSRANYWLCRLECGDFEELEKNEAELEALHQALKGSCSASWHKRKPYILQARLEEQRGNIGKAIDLVREAINIPTDGVKTRYPEMDREYLGRLEKKIGGSSVDP